MMQDETAYKSWIKIAKKAFYDYVHELELACRRNKENHEINSLEKAEENFIELMSEIDSFEENIQYRFRMIKKHWMNLTAFYDYEGAPATNNAIENFYSTSLKTHRKKQFRTEKGILYQMKLASMKRAGMFEGIKPTLFELFKLFRPFAIS